jgi:hypothetical protein
MGKIHIQRLKNAMDKLFTAKVDMSDYDGKPEPETRKAFLSRALAAYCLYWRVPLDATLSASRITDGFDDNGIDSAYFDRDCKTLYLAQAKWIDDGNGAVDVASCTKFLDGCRDLILARFDRFNKRLRAHEQELRDAILDADVRIVLILAHTGAQPLSTHVQDKFDDFLKENNDTASVFSTEIFNQARLYETVASGTQHNAINLEVLLHEWGHVRAPYTAYYGQVDAMSVADWWHQHQRALFARNIRDFGGSTDVNNALLATLRDQPDHFLYYNNGITVLCATIKKKPLGGASRDSGVFECEGVSVVNGAQTVGTLGLERDALLHKSNPPKVFVRLISLEKCPTGFDKGVTRATNTQNRIGSRDFAALDRNQQRLASEMALDDKHYAYKSGDTVADESRGCSIVDATIALACATDVALAVQAKREIGRLWDDIDAAPYTTLFNEETTAIGIWNGVEVTRTVEKRLKTVSQSCAGRGEMIAVHGNRLILHRVFQSEHVIGFRSQGAQLPRILSAANSEVDHVFADLVEYIDRFFPNAYLASFFKNLERCREANDQLEKTAAARRRLSVDPPISNDTSTEASAKCTLETRDSVLHETQDPRGKKTEVQTDAHLPKAQRRLFE